MTDSLCNVISGTVTLTQDVDSCGHSEDVENILELEVVDAGGGPYVILRTERFAVDRLSADRLCDAIKRLVTLAEQAVEPYETGREK